MSETPVDLTQILVDLESGNAPPEATDRLFHQAYRELRRIAGALMVDERRDHTLQPTALVHEAYLRLVHAERIRWEGRAHFLRVAARAMRRILVNHARDRSALKRGGGLTRITLTDDVGAVADRSLEILSLDGALERLARKDERSAQVVELRVFAGMPAREVAHVLGVSKRTVDSDWKFARLWLMDELGDGKAQ